MRRDLLQLRRLPGAPPAALPQRVHLLAPCGRHRAPGRRSADLPLLLSFAHRLARDAARDRRRLRPRESLGRPAPRLAIRSARAAGAFPAPGPRPPGPAGPGAGVAPLPQQGRLHRRPDHQRAARASLAVPILQNERGELYLDALLVGESQLLVLFSFARAYFFVDMEVPAAYVSFLRWLMPKKPRAEIYMAVGLAKQGKTLFYRDLHYHLRHSSDRFVVAPGIKGLVMLVFTLPSFPYVFKVIRDRFAPPKDIDRQTVKDKYLLVKLHDRVGRMDDTLEYSLVALPLERFEPALVDQLRREIGSQLEFDGDKLVIGHVYIERRMRPLNLHVEELRRDGDRARLRQTLRDYGNAIKELAGAGIFPGDMLLKNFGVTRHERIVFYDYDEIAPMTDVIFRRIPPPRDYDDEIAARPGPARDAHALARHPEASRKKPCQRLVRPAVHGARREPDLDELAVPSCKLGARRARLHVQIQDQRPAAARRSEPIAI